MISLNRGSFDVIMGMDWLSKRKFRIVCHEKVVRIPLEGDEILRVHGETFLRSRYNLHSEHKDLVHGATPVAKSPYRLAPLEMHELSEQLRCVARKGFIRLVISVRSTMSFVKRVEWSHLISVGITEEGEVSSVKDKILATSSETSKVENALAEMLRDLDQQMEKRVDDGSSENLDVVRSDVYDHLVWSKKNDNAA
ncbi:hypothetical protein Tco_1093484 [Tanacetum coccineum]|uniref:Polyprotein n=1 Tax=Tanacetum coccineum TaxID=301880 RepID=A0ABQ5ICT7_9ASTR